MSRYRSILDFGWALADVDHVWDAAPPLAGTALGFAQHASGAQPGVYLTTQIPFALNVNRLVDSLVGHPHLRIVGKIHRQPVSDLLGAVLIQ